MFTTLIMIGFAMVAGLLLTRVMKLFNLPNVTGYLIAGLLIGPNFWNLVTGGSFGGLVTEQGLKDFNIITTVALGFIAFSIGGEFKLATIKKLGVKIIVITLVQAFTTVACVIIAMMFIRRDCPDYYVSRALILGAIAAATAPAATLMVVRQYKAKGPVTDTLLPVVAFDDAVGLIIFSVCFALAEVFAVGGEVTAEAVVLSPLREIGLSLAIGAGLGAVLAFMCRFFKSQDSRLMLMICAVILGVGLSQILDLSSLLVCMMIGAVFANLRLDSVHVLTHIEKWTPPVFMLFFVISGADLKLDILPQVGLAGFVYVLVRAFGKYFGAFAGAAMTKSEKPVRNYLGLTLLPQAGVAIGMAQMVAASPVLSASSELHMLADQVVTVVLFATLVYELTGPIITKAALTAAGEIDKSTVKERRPIAMLFRKRRKAEK
ncbi:MAG: cation:proton antiporter [Clostridia bacterium]|nr:cation:proton antiporter [Clostridia bacterium]